MGPTDSYIEFFDSLEYPACALHRWCLRAHQFQTARCLARIVDSYLVSIFTVGGSCNYQLLRILDPWSFQMINNFVRGSGFSLKVLKLFCCCHLSSPSNAEQGTTTLYSGPFYFFIRYNPSVAFVGRWTFGTSLITRFGQSYLIGWMVALNAV